LREPAPESTFGTAKIARDLVAAVVVSLLVAAIQGGSSTALLFVLLLAGALYGRQVERSDRGAVYGAGAVLVSWFVLPQIFG
jgi:hypothetical protein